MTKSRPLAALIGAVVLTLTAQVHMGCHGIEGYNNVYPEFHVPRLGGQHEAYIVAALQAYKTGQRNHTTMVAQASTLSDQDMKDIAAFFSTASAGSK